MTFTKTILLVTLLTIPTYCQTKSDKPVRLTMPKVNAAVSGFTNFGELLASDAELRKQSKEIEKSLPGKDDDGKLGLLVKKLQEKDSRVATAFSKAGIPAQEAALTLQMLMVSALGEAMLQPGQPIPKDMDPALADNLKFVREHKAEITPALEKLQALNSKADETSDK